MSETREKLIATATALLQARGYNGFSFHDLAAAVGVKTASIHYHFPTKADLALALARQYRTSFMTALGPADKAAPTRQTKRYVDLFRSTLADKKMCLCGMMAAEIEEVPQTVRAEIKAFFDDNKAWLVQVLMAKGKDKREAEKLALVAVSALEGAMLIARTNDGVAQFDAVASALISLLDA
jgi:TetR/AcrR family transcriptional regulator, transcriptional repressor for nem operon